MAKSNILTQYFNAEGNAVTVYKARAPRKSEQGFRIGKQPKYFGKLMAALSTNPVKNSKTA